MGMSKFTELFMECKNFTLTNTQLIKTKLFNKNCKCG